MVKLDSIAIFPKFMLLAGTDDGCPPRCSFVASHPGDQQQTPTVHRRLGTVEAGWKREDAQKDGNVPNLWYTTMGPPMGNNECVVQVQLPRCAVKELVRFYFHAVDGLTPSMVERAECHQIPGKSLRTPVSDGSQEPRSPGAWGGKERPQRNTCRNCARIVGMLGIIY